MTSSEELQYAGGERELSYYRDQDTRIEHPNVGQESPEAVQSSGEPRRIRHMNKDEIQDLSLEESLRTALMNAEIIRDSGQFLNPGNRLLSNPDFAPSIYDVAIQETNTLFGQGGTAAALAEFDATFTTNMTWGASEQPAESNSIGVNAGDGQRDEFGDFRSEIAKIFGDGGQLTLEHNWIYTEVAQGRAGARPFNSQFSSRPTANQEGGLPTVGIEYRRPLLQGAGTEYTRIAGPIARRPTLQSTPTVNQGVVIARIRTDIAIAEFEGAVAQLLRDTEDNYWELYLSYRTYDTEAVATQSALETWREVRVSFEEGRVGAADEAQARDNYFESRARREDALARLLNSEVRLRRLMGLPVNDGFIMRPTDDPITTEIKPDWNITLAEALTNRPEIRRQKWNIKSLELQLTAAEMLVRPRLDLVVRYQFNGFGDKLAGGGGDPIDPANGNNRFRSAYGTLFNGEFQGWGLGFEFSMPIGFRSASAQMQNIEHRIGKNRAVLAQQEQEISYEIAAIFQQLDQSYQTAKTNFNRRRAAERRLEAFTADYDAGRSTLDLVLRAQISLAQAEVAYYSSLIGYNRALNDLRFRKGTLLIDNSVFLSESLWTEDAYDDALRRAWARSFAFSSPNLDTAPEEFVLGCIDCEPGDLMMDLEPLLEEEDIRPLSPSPADVAPPVEALGDKAAPPADRSAKLNVSDVIGVGPRSVLPYDEEVLQDRVVPLPPSTNDLPRANFLPPTQPIQSSPFARPQTSTGPQAPPMPAQETPGSVVLPAGFQGLDEPANPQPALVQPAEIESYSPPTLPLTPLTPAISTGPSQLPEFQAPATLPNVAPETRQYFVPPVDIAPPMPSEDAFEPPRLTYPVRRPMPSGQVQPPSPGSQPLSKASRAQLIQAAPGGVPEIIEPMDGFGPAVEPGKATANTGISQVDHKEIATQPNPSQPAPHRPAAEPRPRKRLLPAWGQFFKRD
jgi:outer membrane protein TolC